MNHLYPQNFESRLPLGFILQVRQRNIASLGPASQIIGKLCSLLVLIFLSTAFLAGKVNAADIYIAPTGTGAGTSWNDAAPFALINTATGYTPPSGTHVFLKAGTYSYSSSNPIKITDLTDVAFTGGFPTTATGTDKSGYDPVANPTTIIITTAQSNGLFFVNSASAATHTLLLKGIKFDSNYAGASANSLVVINQGSTNTAIVDVDTFTDLDVSGFGTGPAFFFNKTYGSATFTNDYIHNNAGPNVAAIRNQPDSHEYYPLFINRSSFVNNTSTNFQFGGAINTSGDLTVSDSYFCNNVASFLTSYGGAIATSNSLGGGSGGGNFVHFSITGSSFYNNSATSNGGALFMGHGYMSISTCKFGYNNIAGNGSNGAGGAVSLWGSSFSGTGVAPTTISGSDFYRNYTNATLTAGTLGTSSGRDVGGGAVEMRYDYGSMSIEGSRFVENYTLNPKIYGGAILYYNPSGSTPHGGLSIANSYFSNNQVGNSNTGGSGALTGSNGVFSSDLVEMSNTAADGDLKVTNSYLQLAQSVYKDGSGQTTSVNYDFSGGNNYATPNDGGLASLAQNCPSAINAVAINVTGQVWDDVNGNASFENTENGTNAGGPLYVNLVDATGTLVASTTVSASGSYTLTAPASASGLKLVLTNSATATTPGPLPAQWVNTGQNVGASNSATQSATLGQIELTTGTSPVTAQNFGIEHLPTPGSGTATVGNAGGTSPLTVPPSAFTNVSPSSDNGDTPPGSVTAIRITAFPTNVTSLTINGVVYTASSPEFSGGSPTGVVVPTSSSGGPSVPILVDPLIDTPPASVTFVFKAVDNAGKESTTTGTAVVSFVALPDLVPIIYARPSTLYNTSAVSVVVDVTEVLGVASSGLIRVRLTKSTKIALSFDPTSGSVGGRSVQNSIWSLDNSNSSYYILTTTQVVGAKNKLSFGFSGTLSPGATSGTLTLSSVIEGLSGGELRTDNNTDADKIDYFQQ